MSSILVIEDHAAFGKALVRLLKEKSGLEVVGIVQTGEEALEKLPEVDVDLVLIDVSLPRMNGIQLAGPKARPRQNNPHREGRSGGKEGKGTGE